ncbi:hypothetical protein CEXT_60941 [Caerostris extrusa]|uniref:Uncharacterized protein n=1 Tax=Caerostris extrusa TaxID=172846 RepID=A0AAV4WG76_CAEEX|nr:hypothetical protein CEXT_60941 [Caerostris extrusa]
MDVEIYDGTNVTDFESSVEFSNTTPQQATPQIEEPSREVKYEDHTNKTAYRSRFDPEVSDYDSSVDRESRLGIEGEEYDDGEVYRPRFEQLDSSQDQESYLKQYEEDDDREMYKPHLKQQAPQYSSEVISEERKEDQLGKLPNINENQVYEISTEKSSSDDPEANVMYDVYVDDNQDDDEMESESIKK